MIKFPVRIFTSILICGAAIISPGTCCAAAPEIDSLGSYFRVIWGLLVVLAIILILYGLLRKRISLFHSPASQSIKIIEMKPLMSKKALCLVEVKGEEFLLGLSNDSITHIATLNSKKDSSFAAELSRTDPDNPR